MAKKHDKIRRIKISNGGNQVSNSAGRSRSRDEGKLFVTTGMEEAIFRKEIDKETAIQEVMKCIQHDRAASDALDKLKILGCDEKLIAWKLYMYGGGPMVDVESVKQGYRRRLSFILNLSKRMLEMADQIMTAHAYLADASVIINEVFVSDLKSYAENLSRLATAALKDPGSKKVTARNHHLVFLARMIEVISRRPHYPELAALSDCVRESYSGKPHSSTAENIRDLVRNQGNLDLQSAAELELIREAQPKLQHPPK